MKNDPRTKLATALLLLTLAASLLGRSGLGSRHGLGFYGG